MNKIIQAYKSMSAADLAKKCGVGIDTVYGWRTESKKTRPAVISIVRLSVSLGVSSEECAEAISSLCGKNIEVKYE